MPRRLLGVPTYSFQSRFMAERLIREAAAIASEVDPTVRERVRDEFITRLYGPGTSEGQPRPLLRLSIFEFEALANIALDLCSDHSNDPDAAQKAVAERLQRKVSGPTIFDLVDGVPMETHGEDIMMHGRTVLTDPEACVRPAVSVTLYAESGYVVDPDDHDDFIDGDFRFIAVVPDPAD